MINYEMALSEIEMYRKAHESLGENLRHVTNQRDQYKAERDTLIDDIAVLKANNDRYRKRAENAMDYAERSQCEVLRWERHNKDLSIQSDSYFGQWQQHKALNKEFSQHIGSKPSSSTYKYFRSKLDGIGIKEGE